VRQLIVAGALEARAEGEGVRKTYYLKQTSVVELHKQWWNEPPRRGWPKGRKRKRAAISG
jgi:hypothetical protein